MGRLLNLQFPKQIDLIHDLIKNITILLVIEILLGVFLKEEIFDTVFLFTLAFTILGNLVFYLIVDHIVGAGPVLTEF